MARSLPQPPPDGICTAISKQTGERCRQRLAPGAVKCRHHGGASPRAKQAQMERLAAAADLVTGQLIQLALHSESESVSLQACRDILDRLAVTDERAQLDVTVHEPDGSEVDRELRRLVGELGRMGESGAPVGTPSPGEATTA